MLKPIKNKLVIQLDNTEKETVLDSGIVLTTKDRDEAQRAKVVAVGPDVEFVKEGDIVLPNWNAAEETKFEREKYFIIKEDEIVMILEE
jgi:co-chaperonin GroES (HSP10)